MGSLIKSVCGLAVAVPHEHTTGQRADHTRPI
jgi:hypothetical protein